jgi:fructuronate reductase
MVHLGIGAFHRAHQAVYTEDAALATGEDHWGICGVTLRSADVADRLRPQDGLYTVVERGPGAAPPRVVRAVREVLDGSSAGWAVPDRIADPRVHVVTLTVTEKGYRHGPGGRLRLDDPEVAADLRGRAAPTTVVGRLAAGLVRRAAADAGPLSVLSCDNLPSNGELLRDLVGQYLDAAGAPDGALAQVRFPSTMVDRIVPATTAAEVAAEEERTGLRDEALVVAEPFRQWVIEDGFAAEHPDWAAAGAVLVRDVRPWELLKLRILNASHTLLALLGLRCGYATIAEAATDPMLHAAARRLVLDDAVPVLAGPEGVDPVAYAETVLARFTNPALRHTTMQVAKDTSQKLGPRLLDGAPRAGLPARWSALVVAAWLGHALDPRDAAGVPIALDDPLAADLAGARSPEEALAVLPDLPPAFRSEVLTAHRRLAGSPVAGVVKEMLDG